MPTVRTTLEPWKSLVVSDREAYDLRQQGLLLEEDVDKAPDQDPAAGAAGHPDADERAKEVADAKREELAGDKGQGEPTQASPGADDRAKSGTRSKAKD